MFSIKCILFTQFVCLFTNVFTGPLNHLDLFITRKELRRFFQEFEIGDFYIIRKGVVDNFVKNQLTAYLVTIQPSIQSMELRIQSRYKLYYRLSLASSNRTVMKVPSANIKSHGQVPRKERPFKIRFPCTRRQSGIAMMTLRMEFALPSRKKVPIAHFVLTLRRRCEKVMEVIAPKPAAQKTNYICAKKCDRVNVMRRFCLSDFAIRARVEKKSLSVNGRPLYRVRVTKFYKRGHVAISKRQDIEIYGREVTCKCKPLQLRKTYLFLGKESKRTNSLFLDNYTYAIKWSEGGKKMAKLHKKRDTCPRKFGIIWYPIRSI